MGWAKEFLLVCYLILFWRSHVNAQQNSDSLSFVLTGNTLEDLSTQLEAEANKAFQALEDNPQDLAGVVSSLSAQVVSATTQLMLQFIRSDSESKNLEDLAEQISSAIGSALSQASQQSSGAFSELDVDSIQSKIRNTVINVVNILDSNSSIEEIVEAVGQQVLDIVGQAFAEITGGTFSGTFALSTASTAQNGGNKAINTTTPLDIVEITLDLKDAMLDSISSVDPNADITFLQQFLSTQFFEDITQPMLQLVFGSIQQGQLSSLPGTVSLTVKNALSSLKPSIEGTPFQDLDINQIQRGVAQVVQDVIQNDSEGITELDLTKVVAEKSMSAIINGFNTAVIASTGSLILRTGNIPELTRELRIVMSSVLQSIEDDSNMTDVRNTIVTELFEAMSQVVISIVYTLIQTAPSKQIPARIGQIFQEALQEAVKGTKQSDIQVDIVRIDVEQAANNSLSGSVREIDELTTDAASAAMNAAINILLEALGPSTIAIDSAIDPDLLGSDLVMAVSKATSSLGTPPSQTDMSAFQINILREIATGISALTYSMLDFGQGGVEQFVATIVTVMRPVLREIQTAPGYEKLNIDAVLQLLQTAIVETFLVTDGISADMVSQQVAQVVVDIVAQQVAEVSKVLVTLAVSVSAQFNESMQTPEKGKQAILSVLEDGNSMAVANVIVESLGTNNQSTVSEALVLVLQNDVQLTDEVIAALATSFSIAQSINPNSTDVLIEVLLSANKAGGPSYLVLSELVASALTDPKSQVRDTFVIILAQLGNRSDDGCGILIDLLKDVQDLAQSQQDSLLINETIAESPTLSQCLGATPTQLSSPSVEQSSPSLQFQQLLQAPQQAYNFIIENIDQPLLIASVILDNLGTGQESEIVEVLRLAITGEDVSIKDIAALVETMIVVGGPSILNFLNSVVLEVSEADKGVNALVELFRYSLSNEAPENVQEAILEISVNLVAQETDCQTLQPVLNQVLQSASSPSEQNTLMQIIQSRTALQVCLLQESPPTIVLPPIPLPEPTTLESTPSPPAPWYVGVISVEFQESLKNPESAAEVIIDNIVFPRATALAIVDALEQDEQQENLVSILSIVIDEQQIKAEDFGVVMEVVLQAGGPTALKLMSDVFSVADASVLSLLMQYAFTEAPTVQDAITQVLVQLSSSDQDCITVTKIISNALTTATQDERNAILRGLQTSPVLTACLQEIQTAEEPQESPQYIVRVTMELEQVIGNPEDAKQFVLNNIALPTEVAEALVSAVNDGRYLDVSEALVLLLQEENVQAQQLAKLFQIMLSLDSNLIPVLLAEVISAVSGGPVQQPLASLVRYALLEASPGVQQTFISILAQIVISDNCQPVINIIQLVAASSEEQNTLIEVLNQNEDLVSCLAALTSSQSPLTAEVGLVSLLQTPQEAKDFIVANLYDSENVAVSIVDGLESGQGESISAIFALIFADPKVSVDGLAQIIKYVTILGDTETLAFISVLVNNAAQQQNTDLLSALIQYVFTEAPKDIKDAFVSIIEPIVGCGSVGQVISRTIQSSPPSIREALTIAFIENPSLDSCVDTVVFSQSPIHERNNNAYIQRFQTMLVNPEQARDELIGSIDDSQSVAEAIVSSLRLEQQSRDNLVSTLVLLLQTESVEADKIANVLEIVLVSNDQQAQALLVQVFNEAAQLGDSQILVDVVKEMLLTASSSSGDGFTILLVGILASDETCGTMKQIVSEAIRQSSRDQSERIVEYIRNSDDLYFCVDGALLQSSTQSQLTYYKTKENGTVLVGGCHDIIPPNGENADCWQQQQWGKCERKWMLSGSFCASTCNYCELECIDIQPDLQYTCEQQKLNGQCNSDFMVRNGFCKKTCGRCCSDIVPDGDFTCQQQKQFDKCNQSWMIAGNFCDRTCGRCGATSNVSPAQDTATVFSTPQQQQPTDPPIVTSPSSTPASNCEDVPPNQWFTCEEQKSFGMCDREWMTAKNYCASTCERCPNDSCTDFFPGDTTCAQEKEWGKCDRDWMIQQNYCQRTCGRCSA
eukprot:TRINITY_DN6403_c0_g3_i2.p1 TRINITY_DN6403_c0_g3~~TRINITY_DN6403_c0_g3_i2.p1  ORF type:complete len:2015 (-),score=226.42 TRINITY_DN6403_c0_g3_i2:1689-7733(-)